MHLIDDFRVFSVTFFCQCQRLMFFSGFAQNNHSNNYFRKNRTHYYKHLIQWSCISGTPGVYEPKGHHRLCFWPL